MKRLVRFASALGIGALALSLTGISQAAPGDPYDLIVMGDMGGLGNQADSADLAGYIQCIKGVVVCPPGAAKGARINPALTINWARLARSAPAACLLRATKGIA